MCCGSKRSQVYVAEAPATVKRTKIVPKRVIGLRTKKAVGRVLESATKPFNNLEQHRV